MAAALVCAGGSQARFACDSRCDGCGFLISDRRCRQTTAYLDSAADRRRLGDWAPYSCRLAAADAGRSISAAPRRATAPAPLLLATALVIFNALDSLLTARALSRGVAEGNPLLASLFSFSLPFGMILKTAMVAAGVLVLWGYWHLPLARRGMTALTGFYGAVVLYHIFFQLIVLRV